MSQTCSHHPEQPLQGTCSRCKQGACAECLVTLSTGAFCKRCLAKITQPTQRHINGFLRLLLSALPGVGHLYMGLMQRGLELLGLSIGGGIIVGWLMGPLIVLFVCAAAVYSIFDAREAHLRLAQGHEVADVGLFNWSSVNGQRWLAYGLLVIGGIALFNSVLNDVLRIIFASVPALSGYHYALTRAVRGIALGLASIIAGLWLLRTSLPKGEKA